MMNAKEFYALTAGRRIAGTYHGHAFSGVITDIRTHTCDAKQVVMCVDLDSEIVVFGDPRTDLCMQVGPNSVDHRFAAV